MSLPTVIATVRVYNQNYDNTDPTSSFQISEEREVEVVQLNLNSGGMRVRFADSYQGKNKIVTQDIPATEFFDQYDIVAKG